MPGYPIRFTTEAARDAAGWPDCACGHPARLHGLLPQHVGGSGCFRTYWKDGRTDALRVYAGCCDCATYRPVTPPDPDAPGARRFEL